MDDPCCVEQQLIIENCRVGRQCTGIFQRVLEGQVLGPANLNSAVKGFGLSDNLSLPEYLVGRHSVHHENVFRVRQDLKNIFKEDAEVMVDSHNRVILGKK